MFKADTQQAEIEGDKKRQSEALVVLVILSIACVICLVDK